MPPFLSKLAVSCGMFLAAWLVLGQFGYRAGSLVTLGPAALDPELVRALIAALAAVVGGSLARFGTIATVREFLVQLGLASALTPEEQRDQYARIQRLTEK